MLMLSAVLAFGTVLRRLLQVEFQPVQLPNRIEAIPRLTEREAELSLVGHRARQVIDQELGSEGRHPWLRHEVGHFAPAFMCGRPDGPRISCGDSLSAHNPTFHTIEMLSLQGLLGGTRGTAALATRNRTFF
jgi:hypothetical protein